jgi:hypothetical protein
MTTIRYALGCFLFVVLFAAASMAQNTRTFVSGTGSDSNPCSVNSPCRTFTQAISVTNAGGEVVVQSPAGYGPFTVNKAITVEAADGVYAGIAVTSGDGIDINAGTNDKVILRGLTVYNQGGNNGIVLNTGGTLHIENCIVNGFFFDGILIFGPGSFFVKDTIARGNGQGILVDNRASGNASITMDHVRLDDNLQVGLGLETQVASTATVTASIRNSSTSGNGVGMNVGPASTGGAVSLDVESCLITNNAGSGIVVSGNTFPPTFSGTVSISNSTVSRNPVQGFDIELGSQILSRGNNTISGNGPNSGTLTPLPAQ